MLELDPGHGQTRMLLGWALLQRGDFSEAIEQLRRNLGLSPDSVERLAALAQAYAASGARKNAMQILDRLLTAERQSYVSAYSIAGVCAALGAREKALAYLEKATGERSGRLAELKYDPIFKTLRGEPAFLAVLKRIGL